MIMRILTTASVAALLCVAPAMAQEQAEQPIIKKQTNQGGEPNTAPKRGNADAGQAMPDQGGNAAAQEQNGQQDQTQPLKKKKNQNADQNNMDQQNQNAETDQTKTKKKKNQNAEQTGTDQQDQNAEADQTKKKKAGDTAKSSSDDMNTASSTKTKEVTTKERTVIKEKIVTRNVTRIDRSNINFNISIGVHVPSTIVLNPLPVEIVEVVPQYQGYLFFVLADGTIVIVAPGTMEIVTVIA